MNTDHTQDMEVAILANRKRYLMKTKVLYVEIEQTDSITFVDWMESLDENTN